MTELKQCIYHEEMKLLGINISICEDLILKKKKYCKNHNKCKKCGILTGKRNLYYCPLCICSYNNCNNQKLEGLDNCGNHFCKECKNEKKANEPYCKNCICPFEKCNSPKREPYKGCYMHSCNNCKELYNINKKCKSKECCCISCKSTKSINGFTCYSHTCTICEDLYKKF